MTPNVDHTCDNNGAACPACESFYGPIISALQSLGMTGRITPPLLPPCSWCSPESTPGACDGGYPCRNIATVHDLVEDAPFCRYHFEHRDGVQ